MNTNPLMSRKSVRLISDKDLLALWRGQDASLSPRAKLLICDELHRRYGPTINLLSKRKRK